MDLKKDSNLREGTPNLRLLREVQSLRIAGADKNTPRPYIRFWDRENIRLGCKLSDKYPGRLLSRAEQNLLQQSVLHVDFCLEELEFICKVIQSIRKVTFPLNSDLGSQVISLMNGQELLIADIIDVLQKVLNMPGKQLGRHLLRNRAVAAINGFLLDAAASKINHVPQLVQFETIRRCRKIPSKPSVSALLQQREIGGMAPVRVCRGQQSFNIEIASHLEDTLVRKSEWTDCCGDVSAVSWTGNATFVCGATAHSDYHNMQYNKPGNLVVGSSSLDTLRAIADHRVIRPIIGTAENVENALESMRLTQDPWLYTSVVSTSHSEMSGFTFTASFDETVKVWNVSEDGSSMDLCGTETTLERSILLSHRTIISELRQRQMFPTMLFGITISMKMISLTLLTTLIVEIKRENKHKTFEQTHGPIFQPQFNRGSHQVSGTSCSSVTRLGALRPMRAKFQKTRRTVVSCVFGTLSMVRGYLFLQHVLKMSSRLYGIQLSPSSLRQLLLVGPSSQKLEPRYVFLLKTNLARSYTSRHSIV